MAEPSAQTARLLRPLEDGRDHVRIDDPAPGAIQVVAYGDYLCPYCRRLVPILARLRQALGNRLAYAYRQFPNERVHPGATLLSQAAEAAARQDRFWEMHDRIFGNDHPPRDRDGILKMARELGLDMARFANDLDSDAVRTRVEEDLREGRANGVTGTPTFFVDGLRYDGAWDFHSILEAVQRPVAQRLQRSALVFANLPASGGLVLILAAILAIVCANSPLAPYYEAFIHTPFGIGTPGGLLSMPVAAWFSEGLLAIFFLIVGLEIRREMTAGTLSDIRAALLPIIAAFGGVIAPTIIYLALNGPATAAGWSVPTATDIAFALGVLAVIGSRAPTGLRVFVAALAVVDDILSVLTLAIFYPHNFNAIWLAPCAVAILALFAMNRWRVYATWPYVLVGVAVWFTLHSAGVHGALAGIMLAALLPTRPTPKPAPLLAQAATALAALEAAETEIRNSAQPDRSLEQEPVWDWASRNLSAASDRLLSPADRFEHALSPWATYFVLPLFAFSASGTAFGIDLSEPNASNVFFGVVLGLVVGKPVGIALASWVAVLVRAGRVPDDVSLVPFIGGACLCGIGDTVALLLAEQSFPAGDFATVAKIGVLVGSIAAALLGCAIILAGHKGPPRTEVTVV